MNLFWFLTYSDSLKTAWLVVKKCNDDKRTVFWDVPVSLFDSQIEADHLCHSLNEAGFSCCVYCVPFDASFDGGNNA